jgi:hypothetical protein
MKMAGMWLYGLGFWCDGPGRYALVLAGPEHCFSVLVPR